MIKEMVYVYGWDSFEGGDVSDTDRIAMMIKGEQLGLFKQARGCSYREASEYFDRYNIWEFIDEAYYGLHVQGAQATFYDICTYIENVDGKNAV